MTKCRTHGSFRLVEIISRKFRSCVEGVTSSGKTLYSAEGWKDVLGWAGSWKRRSSSDHEGGKRKEEEKMIRKIKGKIFLDRPTGAVGRVLLPCLRLEWVLFYGQLYFPSPCGLTAFTIVCCLRISETFLPHLATCFDANAGIQATSSIRYSLTTTINFPFFLYEKKRGEWQHYKDRI